jgi:hypothetical protein
MALLGCFDRIDRVFNIQNKAAAIISEFHGIVGQQHVVGSSDIVETDAYNDEAVLEVVPPMHQ